MDMIQIIMMNLQKLSHTFHILKMVLMQKLYIAVVVFGIIRVTLELRTEKREPQTLEKELASAVPRMLPHSQFNESSPNLGMKRVLDREP